MSSAGTFVTVTSNAFPYAARRMRVGLSALHEGLDLLAAELYGELAEVFYAAS